MDTVMKFISLLLIGLASLYAIVMIVNTEKVEGRFSLSFVILSSVLSVNYYIFGNGLFGKSNARTLNINMQTAR